MEMTAFDEIYSRNDGVEKSDFDFLNERLSWELPEEFERLYFQANGFGGRVNDLFVELWDIEQIISFNELYEDVICGQYLFFASSDEGYDSYAYQKEDGKIYVLKKRIDIMAENRCEICGLWKIMKTDICPECNGIMDLSIEEMSLSWKCRDCDYGIATTANKLCFWDEKKYARDCYEKISECPYAEQ